MLDRGVEAVGGLEALRGLENVWVEFDGEGFGRNQSLRPEQPYDRNARRGSFVLDNTRNAARFELEESIGMQVSAPPCESFYLRF